MLPTAFFDRAAAALPRRCLKELHGAYALTEPTAGSDALSIRTRADRSEDGASYLLTGQKQFITNSAIADVFIVFAKVRGDAFTAFIVDRDTTGLEIGGEEQKMGIKGSSTRSIFFERAMVPADRLLGEIGKGHRVAFNILNLGRLGACRRGEATLHDATGYARAKAVRPGVIAEFGLIRQKLAQMAARLYAAESMVYRTGGLVEAAVEGIRGSDSVVGALEEYAIESSINKVFASEMLDRTVDQMVQIYGGNGYSRALSGRLRFPSQDARDQPDLGGHQRNQPPPDRRHAPEARRARAVGRHGGRRTGACPPRARESGGGRGGSPRGGGRGGGCAQERGAVLPRRGGGTVR